MSRHRGVLAAVALLLVGALPACGFADDNYENAQNALDRSRPDLTVPATVTTMKPFQTLPGDETGGSLPVELATPEQRAAAVAQAQQEAEDRKAGRVPGSRTAAPGAPGTAGTPGAPAPAPTSTTVPDTPACRSSRQLQVVGTMVLLSPKTSLPAYRETVAALAGVWQGVRAALPPANRPLADPVVAAYLDVQARSVSAGSVDEVVQSLQVFLTAQSKQITKVLTVLTSLCPQVIDSGQDQAETVTFGK